jgi:AcrR family transcriptional regulator
MKVRAGKERASDRMASPVPNNRTSVESSIDVGNSIVVASLALFKDRGVSAVTVDEIAASLGMSKKTIYKNFPDKHALIRAALEYLKTNLERITNDIVEDDTIDAIEKLNRLTATIGRLISQVNRNFVLDLKRKMPELWRDIIDYRKQRILVIFDKLFTQAERKWFIRKGVRRDIFALILIATIQNIMLPEVLIELPYTPDDVIETIFETLFLGVLTDEARKKFGQRNTGVKK